MSSPATPHPGDLRQGDLRERIVTALRSAKKPVTFKALLKRMKAPEEAVVAELGATMESGSVYRWPSKGQSYWASDPVAQAREAILKVAPVEALSSAELAKRAAKLTDKLPPKYLADHIQDLEREKTLQAVPAFSGSTKLFMLTGAQDAYFKAARSFIESKIAQAGFDASRFFVGSEPATGSDLAERILETVKTMEPVKGVPVSTLRLRNHFRDVSKHDFDKAALELRKKQSVFLSQHADPHNISAEDKELLIDGQDGTYYVAIALR
jgi:hypothetical protein